MKEAKKTDYKKPYTIKSCMQVLEMRCRMKHAGNIHELFQSALIAQQKKS